MAEPTPSWYRGTDTIGGLTQTMQDQISKLPRKPTGELDIGKFLRDTGVNLATQAPLMLAPEASIPARAAMSIAAGTGADKLLNGEDWLPSLLRGAGNTAVSMAIPGIAENKLSYNPAPIQGTGVSALPLKLMNLLNPSSWATAPRMMVRPGASQAVPANMGNVVKDQLLKIPGIPRSVKLGVASIPADILEGILKNSTGLSINEVTAASSDRK